MRRALAGSLTAGCLAALWAAVASGVGTADAQGSPPAGGGSNAPDTLPLASSRPAALPLGIGRPATEDEIAELDIDVMPDGTGLPPGSGTPEEGEDVYRAQCAACHGPEGMGTPEGWPLVERNPGDAFDFAESLAKELRRAVGNYWPYPTSLFDYTRRAMPMHAPGSLSDDEVYAVVAWMLWRNRIIEADEVMDAATLPEVVMPARDRFVPDDRWER